MVGGELRVGEAGGHGEELAKIFHVHGVVGVVVGGKRSLAAAAVAGLCVLTGKAVGRGGGSDFRRVGDVVGRLLLAQGSGSGGALTLGARLGLCIGAIAEGAFVVGSWGRHGGPSGGGGDGGGGGGGFLSAGLTEVRVSAAFGRQVHRVATCLGVIPREQTAIMSMAKWYLPVTLDGVL